MRQAIRENLAQSTTCFSTDTSRGHRVPDTPPVPLLGFVAFSGTGKTSLLTRLIPELNARGVRCAAVKHSHHNFDIDVPGKDSHRLREAGARQVLLASPHRVFMVEEGNGLTEPRLHELVARLDLSSVDLVLVEGFRQERLPKIEVHRPDRGKPLLCLEDDDIIALASDADPGPRPDIPLLPLNEPAAIADFIVGWIQAGAAAARRLDP
jgi:molybdopterin-guanine dinucleotide biosynthesis protein MobB